MWAACIRAAVRRMSAGAGLMPRQLSTTSRVR